MTELTIYQQITDPVSAIASIGKSIAQSQIFGCQNEAQGQVLALECMAKGLPPLALAEQYHFIQGRLSMKADAMLGAFETAGGEFQIKEYSPEACEIVFKRGKNSLSIRISWGDAQQEPWPWKEVKGGGRSLKSNWATPIGRQDLLWARVVSRGVRRLAPGVVSGRYTPEEIQDFDSSNPPVVSGTVPRQQEDLKVTQPLLAAAAVAEPVVESKPKGDEVLDFSWSTEGLKQVPAEIAQEPEVVETASDELVAQIKEQAMFLEQQGIEVAVRMKWMLAEMGLNKLTDLPRNEAEKMLRALEGDGVADYFAQVIGKK